MIVKENLWTLILRDQKMHQDIPKNNFEILTHHDVGRIHRVNDSGKPR